MTARSQGGRSSPRPSPRALRSSGTEAPHAVGSVPSPDIALLRRHRGDPVGRAQPGRRCHSAAGAHPTSGSVWPRAGGSGLHALSLSRERRWRNQHRPRARALSTPHPPVPRAVSLKAEGCPTWKGEKSPWWMVKSQKDGFVSNQWV